MDDIRMITQKILDGVLLPDGIMSHHLRHIEVDEIKHANKKIAINKDEYVVYRVVSSRNRAYGDGAVKLQQIYIDINYYYAYDKNDKRFKAAAKRIKTIQSTFLADPRFRLANGQSDIYDFDNPYRGVNIEFLFIGVCDNAG